jgi:hypothetical protein
MMQRVISFIIVFMFTISVHAQVIQAGAVCKNITPEPLLPVSGGVGLPNPVTVKHGELTARALVLVKEDITLAIVAIDNLGVPKIIGDRIRKLVPQIKPENILIGATHTHSAPDIYGFTDGKGNTGADLNYINFLVEQTADAIREAHKNIKPAYLKVAVDKANGKIAYNAYAPKLYDKRCGVIQLIGATENRTIATVVNYAIHPEVIGSERGICTPDLVGPLYDRIESEVGGVAIFMNSGKISDNAMQYAQKNDILIFNNVKSNKQAEQILKNI